MSYYNIKKNLLLKECRYKFHHFCDGSPNMSLVPKNKKTKKYEDIPPAAPPCPDRFDCEIRKRSAFDEGTTEKENENGRR